LVFAFEHSNVMSQWCRYSLSSFSFSHSSLKKKHTKKYVEKPLHIQNFGSFFWHVQINKRKNTFVFFLCSNKHVSLLLLLLLDVHSLIPIFFVQFCFVCCFQFVMNTFFSTVQKHIDLFGQCLWVKTETIVEKLIISSSIHLSFVFLFHFVFYLSFLHLHLGKIRFFFFSSSSSSSRSIRTRSLFQCTKLMSSLMIKKSVTSSCINISSERNLIPFSSFPPLREQARTVSPVFGYFFSLS